MVVLADPWMRGDWLNGFRHVEIAKVNGICRVGHHAAYCRFVTRSRYTPKIRLF